MRLNTNFIIFTLGAMMMAGACSKNIAQDPAGAGNGVTVGFCSPQLGSKVSYDQDGNSANWEAGDKISLWAKDNYGRNILADQQFTLMAGSGLSNAYFTSILDEPMLPGTYSYVGVSPAPEEVNGTMVSYTIPAQQTGRLEDIGSYDFMLSGITQASNLKKISGPQDATKLGLELKHQFHLLKFYVPAEYELPEDGIFHIKVTSTQTLAGKYTVNLYNQSDVRMDPETASKEIRIATPVKLFASENGTRQYVYALVAPSAAGPDSKMEISVMCNVNLGYETLPIRLEGHDFQAGHSTVVAIRPAIENARDLTVTFTGNESPEPIKSIRLTGPSGLVWEGTDSNVLEIVPEEGDVIDPGLTFTKKFTIDETIYNSNKVEILAEMISDHLSNRNRFELEDFAGIIHHTASIAPYPFLNEDFSNVPTFNREENDGPFNIPTLTGWTGARVGAQQGKAIRLAGFRNVTSSGTIWTTRTEHRTSARADSAPMGVIIAPCTLVLSFDYGTDNTGQAVGQTFEFGYITTLSGQASTSTNFHVLRSKTIASNQKDGSFDDIPNHEEYEWETVFNDVPANAECIRFSFRTTPVSIGTGSGNRDAGTTYVYIDNVKVTLKDPETPTE